MHCVVDKYICRCFLSVGINIEPMNSGIVLLSLAGKQDLLFPVPIQSCDVFNFPMVPTLKPRCLMSVESSRKSAGCCGKFSCPPGKNQKELNPLFSEALRIWWVIGWGGGWGNTGWLHPTDALRGLFYHPPQEEDFNEYSWEVIAVACLSKPD